MNGGEMFEMQQLDSRIQIVAIMGALALMVAAVELVRRRQLGEAYSIIWLVLGSIVMVLALFRNLQVTVANWVGVFYAPSLIFGTLIFLMLGVILYLSIALTRLEIRNRIVTQRVALLEYHVLQMDGNRDERQREAENGV